MRSRAEWIWYYGLMMVTCFFGSTLITTHVERSKSMAYCIIWGLALGITWGSIWKRTFARLFDEDKDGT